MWNYGEAETYRPLTWSGACVDGKASGEGRLIFIYEGRGSYRGNMVAGKAHGHGITNWADGSRYEGEFRDGWHHGRGTYTSADGDSTTCEWRNHDVVDGTCK